jgi:hypothetical protein
MCGMILRLDSRRPLVWRSPRCLQLGVDPRLAVLDDVTDGDARLIDALTVGITRTGLGTLAAQAGVPDHRVDEVLQVVSPALAPEVEQRAAQRPAIAIVGRGVAAARAAGVIGEAGHPVAVGESITRVGGRRPHAAVLVSGHVSDPLEHQRWLRRDIVHLPIVFGEVAVTIGPLVVPGATACLTCIETRRTSADPAWPAVAPQLWGRSAATETAEHATVAAVEALRMLRRSSDEGVAVRIDDVTGERTERVWSPSEQCGCRGLSPRPAPALRRESGSASARPAPTSAAAPTTARALAGHA